MSLRKFYGGRFQLLKHYTSILPDEMEHQASLCPCRLIREETGRVKFMMCQKHQAVGNKFVLTAYLDGGGDLQFHGGPAGDFKRDITSTGAVRVLREFVIVGKIVKERGETEPIRVRP